MRSFAGEEIVKEEPIRGKISVRAMAEAWGLENIKVVCAIFRFVSEGR